MFDVVEVCSVSTVCGRDGVYIPTFLIRCNNQLVRLTDDNPCSMGVELIGFDTENFQVEVEIDGVPKNLTYSPSLVRQPWRRRT